MRDSFKHMTGPIAHAITGAPPARQRHSVHRPFVMAVAILSLSAPALAAHVDAAQLAGYRPAPAQALADHVMAQNPDMLDVLFHVTPPGTAQNLVVAAHIPDDLGEISGHDDLGVASTGKPLVEVQKDGVRIGVLLQMHDRHRRPIGAIGLMFPWRAGDDQAAVLARAEAIRDGLARKIASRDALFG